MVFVASPSRAAANLIPLSKVPCKNPERGYKAGLSGVSCQFHPHLIIRYHVGIVYDVTPYLRREREEIGFMGMKFS